MNEPMDEQRVQAYLALIEQLLGCPQGQEGALLQAQAELVNAGLLAVMAQVAEQMESQGEGNAGWLRGFGARLAQALGRGGAAETAGVVGTEDVAQFLLETLQLVAESQGNPQQIYPVWAQQQARFNAELLALLPVVVGQLFEGDRENRTVVAKELVDRKSVV